MKLLTHLFIFSIMLFFVFAGCKKSDDGTTTTPVAESLTDDEIADAVAKSLVSGEGGVGLTGVVSISGEKSNGTKAFFKLNGITSPDIDSTFHKTGNTQYVTYDYYLALDIKFIKNGKEYQVYLPTCDTAKIGITAYGDVAAKSGKYTYHDSTSISEAYFAGILTSSDTVSFSGTVEYHSNFTAVATNKTYSLLTTMTFTSLKMPKSTYIISSGTLAISIEATLKDGTAVPATGTVTFNGNQTATLSFHNKTFIINLNSGLVVA